MSDDDIYAHFDQVRSERAQRRRTRLERTDDFGWSKHQEAHWYRIIDGQKLHYWPSSNKWLYLGKYYRGGLPRELKLKIEADNHRQRLALQKDT